MHRGEGCVDTSRDRRHATPILGHLEPPAAGRFKVGSSTISFTGNVALPIP